jgi:hexosaminidase
MGNTKKVEYMLFPRLAALSEVLWSPKEKRNWEDFQTRLLVQFQRYDLWSTNYSRAYFDLRASVLPSDDSVVLWKLEGKLKDSHIMYMNEISPMLGYINPIPVKRTHTYSAALYSKSNQQLSTISQKFIFSKATGKKITLTSPASDKYPGDGPFTLVNGVINEKGFARSREFLGFNGTDCEALINLGPFQTITSVTVHVLQQQSSWIWAPLSMEAFSSDDGQYFSSLGKTDKLIITSGGNGTMTVKGSNTGRFVRVLVKNHGIIPEGSPGAGNKAWLFIDEIEVSGPTEAETKGNN